MTCRHMTRRELLGGGKFRTVRAGSRILSEKTTKSVLYTQRGLPLIGSFLARGVAADWVPGMPPFASGRAGSSVNPSKRSGAKGAEWSPARMRAPRMRSGSHAHLGGTRRPRTAGIPCP